ncbi:MAG: hypothetical protein KKE02_03485 [Alphaproteobacteria bacterium]|nr:hypothetical protein [Alphaproteobacteria bacterium]MBU1517202.1 hypothetical protein [Alphaproteobacteria bacterium]MBU2093262.1 hypothetical protein [Alphaproteobacteria bacterium]MBU2150061.1 hypothetical protein [Alphaproteobacteria bacterium]MBU2307818.1 hypothetical protein [Alphaproteobacteria bacterium]
MQTFVTWAGRAVLLVVLGVALVGALDPHHNAARNVPAPDVVEHVAYGFLLTVLTIASLPRVNPWLIGGGYLALGAGFEALQVAGLVSGTFQWKDLASNTGGVGAALAAFALGRRRGGGRR